MNYLSCKTPELVFLKKGQQYRALAAILRFPESPEEKEETSRDEKGVYGYLAREEDRGDVSFVPNQGLSWKV